MAGLVIVMPGSVLSTFTAADVKVPLLPARSVTTTDPATAVPPPSAPPVADALDKAVNVTRYYHFDGLADAAAVAREIAWLDEQAQAVVRRAAKRKRVAPIVYALGIVLHAVQDFYSHSNFADVDWRPLAGTRVVTLDTLPNHVWASTLAKSCSASSPAW